MHHDRRLQDRSFGNTAIQHADGQEDEREIKGLRIDRTLDDPASCVHGEDAAQTALHTCTMTNHFKRGVYT
jgi:hypothetical protein